MTTIQTSNRFPLLAAIIGVLILLGLGGYLFWRSDATSGAAADNDKADMAAASAEKALAAAGMNADDRKATEAVVRAYILANPEIITEAVEILQKREIVKRLDAAGSKLRTPFPGAVAGNAAGDVTVVEFTDYSCSFCRASLADVQKLVASDSGVRVIYREVPILTAASRDAALWALAAAKQGKHKAFHDAMFAGGRPDEQTIKAAAVKAGLDMAAAQKFTASSEAVAEIENNLAMMQQVGFSGTPTFVIGDQILEGALGYDALKAAVAKARKET
ncbi:MAG: DsbA family protein [Sphingorhabdus sp.]